MIRPSQLLVCLLVATLAAPAWRAPAAEPRDLWVHPRGESFDPARHYRDEGGELYYREENDIGGSLGPIRLHPAEQPRLRVELGDEIVARARTTGGSLAPVFLYDSDGDGAVDRRVPGRLDGRDAVFEAEPLEAVDLSAVRWQLGILYVAGAAGDAALDGRYLASVDGSRAKLVVMQPPQRPLPPVAAPPTPPAPPPRSGLVILQHQEGEPFDFAEFAARPARFAEGFEALTPEADGDAWTVEGGRGRLRTRFDRENLFLVSVTPELDLELRWGDVPLREFLEGVLEVPANGDGCYSTLHAELRNEDGSPVTVPNRILYCPDDSVALFDVPNGYEVELAALRGGAIEESTQAGSSTADNLRLYVREVWPRHASRRGTGSVSGNIRAGLRDAGGDVRDAARHLLTGAPRVDMHTGRRAYRPSPLTAPPRAVLRLLQGRPRRALGELLDGGESAVQAAADVVSAADNAVLNPLIQAGVGSAVSPDAADLTADWVGAATQAAMKNLPLGERARGFVDVRSWWYHDRAWEPVAYTRTDTQLNIDRAFTVLDVVTLRAVRIHNRSRGGAPRAAGGAPLGGDQVVETPFPPPSP